MIDAHKNMESYRPFLKTRSVHTRRAYEYVIQDFVDYISNIGNNAITISTVQDYINNLSNKNSPATIRQRYAIVKSFLKHSGHCVDFDNISLPRMGKKPKNVLDKELLGKYLDEVQKIRRSAKLKALLVLLPLSGVRIGEACGDKRAGLLGIRKQDIIKCDGAFCIRVLGKENKTRDIPLAPLAQAVLLPYAKRAPSDILFKFNHNTVRRKLKDIGYRIGAPWLTPHSMRHTFITDLTEKGVPLHVVRELAGHASSTTTLSYCHAGMKSKIAAVDKLEFSGERHSKISSIEGRDNITLSWAKTELS